jgi:hypothetical protein
MDRRVKTPKVTVVLGSCRPGGLDVVFPALAAQTYDDFEVLFVDGRYRKRHEPVLAAAYAFGLVDKVGVGGFMHVPNHRNPVEGDLWTTPCAGFNTGIMLAAGEIVVFMMDYAMPAPGWLEAHVKAHEGGPRLVMGDYRYFDPPAIHAKPGVDLRVFKPGDVTGAEVVAQRERFDEGYVFEAGFRERIPTEVKEHHRALPEGPLAVTWCHTKNESFPRQAALAINGFPEWYDRVCGPGDIDFGYQLGEAGLEGWLSREATLDAIDMRWILTNGSIVVPRDRFSTDPLASTRPYYDLGDRFYTRRRGIASPINNHYDLREKSATIWHWREWGAMPETVIPPTEMADADYFPEWHTEVVRAIARGESVTV